MSLTKVHSDDKYDYYLSPAFGNNQALYNIVPKGSKPPTGGYRNMQYIENIKHAKFPERYQPTSHGMSNLYTKKENKMSENKIKNTYMDKANYILAKEDYEMDDENDIGVETAKSILSTYIDRCVEEGTKELGDEYGLDDVEGSYEIVQGEIERIAGQLQNYLKKGVQ